MAVQGGRASWPQAWLYAQGYLSFVAAAARSVRLEVSVLKELL